MYHPSSAGLGSCDKQVVSLYSPPVEKKPRRHPDTNSLLLLLLLQTMTGTCSALTNTRWQKIKVYKTVFYRRCGSLHLIYRPPPLLSQKLLSDTENAMLLITLSTVKAAIYQEKVNAKIPDISLFQFFIHDDLLLVFIVHDSTQNIF